MRYSKWNEFDEQLRRIAKLHDKKQHDYAGNILYKNLRDFGWKGVVVRIGDKYHRLKNIAKGQKPVVEETVIDTLMDLAVYSLIAIILYNEEKNETK